MTLPISMLLRLLAAPLAVGAPDGFVLDIRTEETTPYELTCLLDGSDGTRQELRLDGKGSVRHVLPAAHLTCRLRLDPPGGRIEATLTTPRGNTSRIRLAGAGGTAVIAAP